MSKPLVAVVGRPNVGKSTLFNRLIGKRVAIVEDTPGITRDRLYHDVEWRNREFVVIDTGGILPNEVDPLLQQVRAQAQIAMDEADAILFMADAADGLTPADEVIADMLRSAPAPVFLVVNKADNKTSGNEALEFYALGMGQVYPISSIHGHGIADLLDDVVDSLPVTPDIGEDDEDTTRLAIIGRPNVGKSSLVNAILGEKRVIVSPIAGTTRDAIDTPLVWNDRKLVLIDTAGIRRAGKIQGSIEYYTVLRAKTAIERCDVALTLIDAEAGLSDGDKRAAGMAHEAGRGGVLVVNKWDLVDPGIAQGKAPDREKIEKFTETIRRETPFMAYAPIVFISAEYRFGVKVVLETALDAAESHAFRISTGALNRLFRDAVEDHPLNNKGRPLKLYYATMAEVKPPTIVLFVNDPEMLHFSYQRYLENRLRAVYPMEGTPVRLGAKRGKEDDRR